MIGVMKVTKLTGCSPEMLKTLKGHRSVKSFVVGIIKLFDDTVRPGFLYRDEHGSNPKANAKRTTTPKLRG